MELKHKQFGEIKVDDVMKSQKGKVIAAHIKNLGWKPAEEFELTKANEELSR